MMLSPISTLIDSSWYIYSDEPVISGSFYKQRLSDPEVLTPEESPDGRWHMFAHSWVGVEHFVSNSGFDWKPMKLVVVRGQSPFIYKQDQSYYLFYETHDRDYQGRKRRKNRASRISVMKSNDLAMWTTPEVVLESKDVPCASDFSQPRVSRPQVIFNEGKYFLYFGSSEVKMYDSKQKAAAYFCLATSDNLMGPYKVEAKPIISIEPDGRFNNLAVGSVKVLPCLDALAAIQSTFIFDEKQGKSRSVLILLSSKDGRSFKFERVLMESPEKGWASGYISCAEVIRIENEQSWYCYFSANVRSSILPFPSKGGLGLLLGHDKIKTVFS